MYKIWFKINDQIARLDEEFETMGDAFGAALKIFGKGLDAPTATVVYSDTFRIAAECPYEK